MRADALWLRAKGFTMVGKHPWAVANDCSVIIEMLAMPYLF